MLDDQVFSGELLGMEKRSLAPGYLSLAFPGDIFSEYDTANAKNRDEVNQFQNYSLFYQNSSEDADQIYMGMQILRQLKHINWCRDLVKTKYRITGSWFLGPPITGLYLLQLNRSIVQHCAILKRQKLHCSIYRGKCSKIRSIKYKWIRQ